MNLYKQVISLELAKKLKELDIKQESYFWWVNVKTENIPNGAWFLLDNDDPYQDGAEIYSAFTVAELGEMLFNPFPNLIINYKINGEYVCAMGNGDNKLAEFKEKIEANARAKMLIYLLENDLIKLNPV